MYQSLTQNVFVFFIILESRTWREFAEDLFWSYGQMCRNPCPNEHAITEERNEKIRAHEMTIKCHRQPIQHEITNIPFDFVLKVAICLLLR